MGYVGTKVTQNIVSTSEITDGTITNDDLASDIAITTTGDTSLKGNVVINEDSADKDFRVESDNRTHALFVDGAGGNIGIDATPESWHSNWTAIDIGDQGSIAHYDGGDTQITTNMYHDGAWKAKETGTSALYAIGANGSHTWYTGASASADASITQTLVMMTDANGIVTKPLQPSFQVHPASNQENIAYNTWTTVVFGTERYDTNGDFASNTFTAPVTGKYMFTFSLDIRDVDDDVNTMYAVISTSNRTYYTVYDFQDIADSDVAQYPFGLAAVADMDASDTCDVKIWHNGSTNMDIHTDSFFSGALLG